MFVGPMEETPVRSKKLVAVLMGTALLGVTSLGGVAAAEAADAAKPAVPPVGSAAPATHHDQRGQADAAPAADAAGADARTARALTEMRALIENGVPGADPVLDARLRQALVTADRALTSVRGHATAQRYTHSWTLAVKPALPFGVAAGAADAPEAAPQATVDVPPLPDLGLDALLEAVKSLDLGKVLESLTKLLDGVLSTLTGTVSGITQSLSGITAGADVQVPDVPEIQIPEIQIPPMPEIKLPEIPEFKFPDIKMPVFQMPGMPKISIPQMPAFRELPGRHAGR